MERLLLYIPKPTNNMQLNMNQIRNQKPKMKMLHHRTAYLIVMASYVKNERLNEAIEFHQQVIEVMRSGNITKYIPTINSGKWPIRTRQSCRHRIPPE